MSAVEAAARVRQHGRSERAALGVFIVGCLAAFAFYALYLGVRLYVGGDDLLLLSERPPGFLDAALSAFVAHWSTLPHLVGRVVYELFGFRSGMAWTAVGTACWTATAVMVRVLSRQAGTGPWIATTAGLAVLTCIDIYPPTQPLTYQVPMAVACGLAACAVANRACLPWAWLLGLLAIMSSAAGVPFVVSAASILWLRGGTKRAGLYAATLGGIFLLWYLGYGPQPVEMPFSVWDEPPTALLQWMLTGLGAGFMALGHLWRASRGSALERRLPAAGPGAAGFRPHLRTGSGRCSVSRTVRARHARPVHGKSRRTAGRAVQRPSVRPREPAGGSRLIGRVRQRRTGSVRDPGAGSVRVVLR